MKRFCLALDLKDDPKLKATYLEYHKNVSEAIKTSITDAGIINLDIYCTGNRLFMIMETTDTFDFNYKKRMDADNQNVQEWETLMWKYQQPLPWAKQGEKWILMDNIFQL